jgi:hypothetical protein
MKAMKTIKTTVLLILLIMPSLSSAQLSYEIYANYGLSKFIQKDYDDFVDQIVDYKWSSSYTIGGNVNYQLKKTRFSFVSGIDYTIFSSKNSGPIYDETIEDFNGTQKWTEILHSLRIPLQIGFQPDNVIRIKLGVSNTFNLKASDEMWALRINRYNLGGIYNIDFFVAKRIVIGLELYHDITPFAKTYDLMHLPMGSSLNQLRDVAGTYDIEYRTIYGSIKLGYIIGK